MQRLPDALAPLAAYRQFIVYTLSWNAEKNKYDKFPVDYRTGRMPPKGTGGAHWPEIWVDVQTAIDAAARFGQGYGVGFVFTLNDPFWFLDIDNCAEFNPDGSFRAWSATAQYFCNAFPGAAVEVSSSGKGLHIFGTGICPPHGSRNKSYGLEFYTEGRFVALTGTNATGNAAAPFGHVLPWLVANFFPPHVGVEGLTGDIGDQWSQAIADGPCEEWRGPTDDEDLLRRALRSTSSGAAFGGKASFRDLFECNVEVLARVYPPDGVNSSTPYNASSVDRALAQHLAFWTGKDCERIDRLMRRSALVREKWNERDDYLPRTILSAVGEQGDVLTDKEVEPVQAPEGAPAALNNTAAPTMVTGSTYVGITEQLDMFKGCVYVVDENRVLVPGGQLIKESQFKAIFGGYTFMLDHANDRTTRDPYEALLHNQAYRIQRVDSTTFKPSRPFGDIIVDAGRRRVNVYWPIEVPRVPGDVSPFMTHLTKLLPNERDREILLAYMCACVQHKGVKFQWAPLLQGVEGNGKTLLTRCVAEAIGKRYVHWPKASKLAKEFNKWMLNKLFYAVEDIYVPGNRREVIEELKPMITGDELEIEGKGVDQISADVCGNFMFNSNHKDAIAKTRNDRRFAVLYTAQQHAADLARDGMTGNYMPSIYGWLKDGGYAIVSELLHTRPIPDEFNPATSCQRAPFTSSTEEAITESLGTIEQEINEAIIQNRPGFCGGWVSSIKLGELLEQLNAARRVPLNKRKPLMESLGYIPHPGMKDGRLDQIVLPDGGKPVLYIRSDHADRLLREKSEIARAYTKAQGVTMGVM